MINMKFMTDFYFLYNVSIKFACSLTAEQSREVRGDVCSRKRRQVSGLGALGDRDNVARYN